MKSLRLAVAASLLALAGPALAVAPSEEPTAQQFSALSGVEAEALLDGEMDAIHGALTAQDLYDALVAKASLIGDPVLRQKVLDYLAANQVKLIAFFEKLLSWHL